MAIDKQSKDVLSELADKTNPKKNCQHPNFKIMNSVPLPFGGTMIYYLCNNCHHQWQNIEESPEEETNLELSKKVNNV